MFAKYFASFALLTALCVPHASAAVVSLYLPAESGVPFTADPIGTDSSGHTSWRLGIGAASGTFTVTQDAAGPSEQTADSESCPAAATLVEGASDLHVFGGTGGAGARVDCAYATPTASGEAIVASCTAEVSDRATTLVKAAPPVTLVPLAVQVSDDGKPKSNGAGNLQMSLGGVAVSALSILSTAGMMLVRM
ncbi:hypothetical protein V8D89_007569 [Ganoderma adspersum]